MTPKPPIDELARYTSVPGLVGELVDWITATSRRPNRVLALGAAVTVVGTLIGRRAAGPTRSATHLYAVGIAPTGSGKQHLLDSIIRLHGGGQSWWPHRAVEVLLPERGARPVVQQAAGPVSAGRDRGVPQGRDQQESDQPRGGRQPDPARPCGASPSPACRRRHGRSARCSSSRARHCRSSESRRRRSFTLRCRARAPSTVSSTASSLSVPTFEPRTVTRKPIRATCQPF